MGLNELLQKINRRVGEPRNLEVQRRLAVDHVVGNTTRDVLWMKNKIPDHSADFLRNGAVHIYSFNSKLRIQVELAGTFSSAGGAGCLGWPNPTRCALGQ